MKTSIRILLILCCCTIIAACHRHQPTPTAVTADTVRTDKPAAPRRVQAAVAPMDYQWFSTRIALSINNIRSEKEVASLTAFVVNKKDSALFITLNKLGIEIARLLLTKDSVKFANHLSREYYWGTYTWLTKQIGMDINFYTVQALISAQDLPGFEHVFIADTTADSIVYTAAGRNNIAHTMILEEKIVTDTMHHMLYHYIKDISSLNTLCVNYNKYTPIDNYTCYQSINIEIPNENIRIDGLLKNTKFNIAGPTTSRIPVKYTPIGTSH